MKTKHTSFIVIAHLSGWKINEHDQFNYSGIAVFFFGKEKIKEETNAARR